MNILVTGGAGFIGSHTCEFLLKQGHRVAALDNFDPFYADSVKRRNIEACGRSDTFKLIQGDYGDRLAVGKVLHAEKFDSVLHLAGQPGVHAKVNTLQLEKDNVGNLVSFLEALKEHGPRNIVVVSSSAVYGANCTPPFHEDSPCLCPGSIFGASKRAIEILLATYSQLYSIKSAIVRPFNVYGPRQRPDMAVSTFTRKLLLDEPIILHADGLRTRDYINISDVVPVLAQLLEKPPADYGIWNLGTGIETSQRQILTLLEQITGRRAKLKAAPAAHGDVSREFADITKLKRDFNFEPKMPLHEGLQQMVAWLKDEMKQSGALK